MKALQRALFGTLAIVAVTFGACSSSGGDDTGPSAAGTSPAATVAPDQQTKRPEGELSVAEVVRQLEPSVVRVAQVSGGRDVGVGTGFVVGADGYIMTNNHVVAGSTRGVQIKVTMSDGSVHDARIIGTDPRTDTAILKIEATGLKPVSFGTLAETAVGQAVVAMGFALDLKGGEGPSYSVTLGIVSAKNRGIAEDTTILGSIQTDAAINHGNSGGPLLNLYGQVVGMNTAIAPDTTTGGIAPGIGFAVGVDTLAAVYEEIREIGKVDRGLLGIANFEAVRPARARELSIPEGLGGVLIGAVSDGGPAASAGIRVGDVITKLGQYSLKTEAELAVALVKLDAGDRVDVELYRDGKKQSVMVTLGTPPA